MASSNKRITHTSRYDKHSPNFAYVLWGFEKVKRHSPDFAFLPWGPKKPTAAAHDSFNRLLNRQDPDREPLWKEAEPLVEKNQGVLVFDDSTLDKPYARHIPLVTNHWSGSGRMRTGRNCGVDDGAGTGTEGVAWVMGRSGAGGRASGETNGWRFDGADRIHPGSGRSDGNRPGWRPSRLVRASGGARLGSWAYFASTDLARTVVETLRGYGGRWSCEVANFYTKTQLGLADFRVRSYEAVERYVVAVHLAWAYAEERWLGSVRLRSGCYGDVIRRHRDDHAAAWLRVAVEQGIQTGDIESVLDRFLRRTG